MQVKLPLTLVMQYQSECTSVSCCSTPAAELGPYPLTMHGIACDIHPTVHYTFCGYEGLQGLVSFSLSICISIRWVMSVGFVSDAG